MGLYNILLIIPLITVLKAQNSTDSSAIETKRAKISFWWLLIIALLTLLILLVIFYLYLRCRGLKSKDNEKGLSQAKKKKPESKSEESEESVKSKKVDAPKSKKPTKTGEKEEKSQSEEPAKKKSKAKHAKSRSKSPVEKNKQKAEPKKPAEENSEKMDSNGKRKTKSKQLVQKPEPVQQPTSTFTAKVQRATTAMFGQTKKSAIDHKDSLMEKVRKQTVEIEKARETKKLMKVIAAPAPETAPAPPQSSVTEKVRRQQQINKEAQEAMKRNDAVVPQMTTFTEKVRRETEKVKQARETIEKGREGKKATEVSAVPKSNAKAKEVAVESNLYLMDIKDM